jgi:hypothetical protein
MWKIATILDYLHEFDFKNIHNMLICIIPDSTLFVNCEQLQQ